MSLNPLPDMHRIVDGRSDWENSALAGEKLNFFQKVASKTFGIVTPGNIISVTGFAATYKGLKLIEEERYASGLAWVVGGRTCDLIDGYVAGKTKTKGRVGEMVDAYGDSRLLAIAMPILVEKEIISPEQEKKFGQATVDKYVSSGVAKLSDIEMHAERGDKFRMAGAWAGPALNIASEIVQGSVTTRVLRKLGDTVLDKSLDGMKKQGKRNLNTVFGPDSALT